VSTGANKAALIHVTAQRVFELAPRIRVKRASLPPGEDRFLDALYEGR